jgi:hypothetical protein
MRATSEAAEDELKLAGGVDVADGEDAGTEVE